MTSVEISTIVTAIATTIYTAGTFLLWRTTEKNIKLVKRQVEREEKIMELGLVNDIYRNFRTVYMEIIKDEQNLQILATARNLTPEETRKAYLASFLINHVYEIFSANEKGFLPHEVWEKTIDDIQTLFKWNFIQTRWGKVHLMYPASFQKFVETNNNLNL